MTSEPRAAVAVSGTDHGDELDLVQQAASDAEAFGVLYERHVRRIYNYIYYRTGNHHDAEDLTARVFQRALGHVGKFEDKGVPFSAWLYRIAHNLVANWHRDRSRRPTVPLEDHLLPSGSGSHPEAVAVASEEQGFLMEAVRRLPEDRQQLLILKFVERLSNAEIGVIMGRTEGAIKSLYHRTLNTLRDELAGQGGEKAERQSDSGLSARAGGTEGAS
ncbi:MAG TPA: sigma-70 family RNA polymerase sigma factor [Anaerolineales bacterium]|nr:sigma-70 family RNA polymerase sigma factor [Anaerolineales bacterium]